MRVLLQRVSHAEVTVDGREVASIGPGLLLLVGVGRGDPASHVDLLADKVAGLRVFEDDESKTNLALADVAGEVLIVSQFTLYGDVRKGRRPSFVDAAEPRIAEPLVSAVAEQIAAHGIEVSTGRFGAHMDVELVNDGPVTLVLAAEGGRIL